jgi:hypothetical protein
MGWYSKGRHFHIVATFVVFNTKYFVYVLQPVSQRLTVKVLTCQVTTGEGNRFRAVVVVCSIEACVLHTLAMVYGGGGGFTKEVCDKKVE